MDYYTSSETGSQETVKFNGNKTINMDGTPILSTKGSQLNGNATKTTALTEEEPHDSNESGFDERRDSSSSQEQLDKELVKVKMAATLAAMASSTAGANGGVAASGNDGMNESNNNCISTIYETIHETMVNNNNNHNTRMINEEKTQQINGGLKHIIKEELRLEQIINEEEEENEEPEVKEILEKKEVTSELKSTTAMKLQEIKDLLVNKQIDNTRNGSRGLGKLYDSAQNIANSEQTFYEEEYSYEPELKRSSSKLVLRTRSLLNLEEESNNCTVSSFSLVRPTAVRTKITTGPDGTFVIAGRKASSELNLSDESNTSPSSSPKTCKLVSGEELKKRKQEIFKGKEITDKPVAAIKEEKNKCSEENNKNSKPATKESAISNLKKYLKEKKIGLKELLTNNNVVIIEPYREEPVTGVAGDVNEFAKDFDKGCRITGATIKPGSLSDVLPNSESNTLPRAAKPHQPHVQRHYFYHLIKTKPDLKDEELPDPDKVRNTRQMFQKVMKIRGVEDTGIMLPIAAKIVNPSKETKPRITPEVRVIDDGSNVGGGGSVIGVGKKRHQATLAESTAIQHQSQPRNPADLKNEFKKCINHKKWTDSGSLSSGVSSDMSCFDNELDNNLDDDSQKGYSTDDEADHDLYQENEVHPVSAEVMQKIRACGTTVTYYGGRVISHSHGPVRSPMTMTIMDEIRQGNENSGNSSRKQRDQYMGVKFRLIKSNSCGSRLELAGTDDTSANHHQQQQSSLPPHHEPSKNRFYEDVYGKSLGDELAECRGRMEPIEDVAEENNNNGTRDIVPQPQPQQAINIAKVQAVFEQKITKEDKPPVQSWRALIESRKQSRAKELRRPCADMEFEEFQVAES